MMNRLLAVAALAGSAFAMSLPASAMSVDLRAGVTKDSAAKVAWYCHRNGNCVRAPRPGYVVRNGWDPGCGPGWGWNGFRCVGGPVYYAPPAVVYAPPVVVRPGPTYIAPGVKVRPNGTVVIRP